MLAACGDKPTVPQRPSPSLTPAQAYEALSIDTSFKFCRDACGPNALQRMLTGVEHIPFPPSMTADVQHLERALGFRLYALGLKTLPPQTDGGRSDLDAADARVRTDLTLPTPSP